MKTSFVLTLATFLSAAIAMPTATNGGGGGGGGGEGGAFDPCKGGLYSSPQCCATDVLGVADLNCLTPSAAPTSYASFTAICAANGQRDRCCVIPILGQSVLCVDPLAS